MCDEVETAATVAGMLKRTGLVVDPHTAVGIAVGERHLGATPMVTLGDRPSGEIPGCGRGGVRPPGTAGLGARPDAAGSLPALPAEARAEHAIEARSRATETVA